MIFWAHVSSGYLVGKLIQNINSQPNYKLLFYSILVGTIFPDLDIFFFRYIKDHHDSPLHTPFFWLLICTFIYLYGTIIFSSILKTFIKFFFLGVNLHMFLDWSSGRAAGIRIFYPFADNRFSLFPLYPEKAKFSMFSIPDLIKFYQFYLQNRLLVGIEILIIIGGIMLWLFVNRIKLKSHFFEASLIRINKKRKKS